MNPVILLASYVVFALGIASAAPGALVLGALALATARRCYATRLPVGTVRRACRRVRWLLLAVCVTHGWFTPGQMLLPALGAASPSREGMLLALWRAAVLLELVGGAALLMALAGRDGLAGALYRLAPARGGLRERLAVRMALSLAALPWLEARIAVPAAAGGRLARLVAGARGVFAAARVPDAGFAPTDRLVVGVPPRPTAAEWTLPLALAALFALAHGVA